MKSKLLDESVVATAKEMLKKIGNTVYVTRKLHAVIAASKHNITSVAKIYDISRGSLTEWIKHVKLGKLDKLRAPKARKRKSILNDEDRKVIIELIEKDPNLTIKYITLYIEKDLHKKISKSSVHREIKKLKYSYITPRKQHALQDKEKVLEFKKKYS